MYPHPGTQRGGSSQALRYVLPAAPWCGSLFWPVLKPAAQPFSLWLDWGGTIWRNARLPRPYSV